MRFVQDVCLVDDDKAGRRRLARSNRLNGCDDDVVVRAQECVVTLECADLQTECSQGPRGLHDQLDAVDDEHCGRPSVRRCLDRMACNNGLAASGGERTELAPMPGRIAGSQLVE
nr:hypothetical protein [Halochromatium glycolicum]